MLQMLSPHDRQYLMNVVKEILRYVENQPTTTHCWDCVHNQQGYCDKWDERIPDEAKEKGCNEFIWNDLLPPF